MTTKNGPLDVIVASFDTEAGADAAFQRLEQAHKLNLIDIDNAAILRKDAQGKVHLEEPGLHPVRKGMGRGALVGAVLGLLFPPSILASAAVGAAVGGLVGKLRDSGFDDRRLRQVADGLTPNSSALIAVVEPQWLTELQQRLRDAGATVATTAIKTDIAQQLREQAGTR